MTFEQFDARFTPYLRGILLDGYATRSMKTSELGLSQENMHRHLAKAIREMYAALNPVKDEKPANRAVQQK